MDFLSIMNGSSIDGASLEKLKRGVGRAKDGVKQGEMDPAEKRNEFKKIAREMESLFAYQLLKVMRETTDSMSAEKKGQGHDTYMTLFDMEISKLFGTRGMGLQDNIVSWLERSEAITQENKNKTESGDNTKDLSGNDR